MIIYYNLGMRKNPYYSSNYKHCKSRKLKEFLQSYGLKSLKEIKGIANIMDDFFNNYLRSVKNEKETY